MCRSSLSLSIGDDEAISCAVSGLLRKAVRVVDQCMRQTFTQGKRVGDPPLSVVSQYLQRHGQRKGPQAITGGERRFCA